MLVGRLENPSFPRRRESSVLILPGSHFRGNDSTNRRYFEVAGFCYREIVKRLKQLGFAFHR